MSSDRWGGCGVGVMGGENMALRTSSSKRSAGAWGAEGGGTEEGRDVERFGAGVEARAR